MIEEFRDIFLDRYRVIEEIKAQGGKNYRVVLLLCPGGDNLWGEDVTCKSFWGCKRDP